MPQSSLDEFSSDQSSESQSSVDEVSSVINEKGFELINKLGDRFSKNQKDNLIGLILTAKQAVQKELSIELNGGQYHELTNGMIERLFRKLNEKLSNTADFDEKGYTFTTARNHWKDLSESELENRVKSLETLNK